MNTVSPHLTHDELKHALSLSETVASTFYKSSGQKQHLLHQVKTQNSIQLMYPEDESFAYRFTDPDSYGGKTSHPVRYAVMVYEARKTRSGSWHVSHFLKLTGPRHPDLPMGQDKIQHGTYKNLSEDELMELLIPAHKKKLWFEGFHRRRMGLSPYKENPFACQPIPAPAHDNKPKRQLAYID